MELFLSDDEMEIDIPEIELANKGMSSDSAVGDDFGLEMDTVRGYSLYLILGMLSLCLLHIYFTCHTYAAYSILHFSSPHCPSS